MKGDDFADGIYWLLHAINYKTGGRYDFSCGIDYKNEVFETKSFWEHSECECSYQNWQWDMDELTRERMKQYGEKGEDTLNTEWWRLYRMEWGNVTQGRDPGHDADCALTDWHFKHFASGLEVSWYKRVGRSTKSNKSLKTLDWFKVMVECLESVRDA